MIPPNSPSAFPDHAQRHLQTDTRAMPSVSLLLPPQHSSNRLFFFGFLLFKKQTLSLPSCGGICDRSAPCRAQPIFTSSNASHGDNQKHLFFSSSRAPHKPHLHLHSHQSPPRDTMTVPAKEGTLPSAHSLTLQSIHLARREFIDHSRLRSSSRYPPTRTRAMSEPSAPQPAPPSSAPPCALEPLHSVSEQNVERQLSRIQEASDSGTKIASISIVYHLPSICLTAFLARGKHRRILARFLTAQSKPPTRGAGVHCIRFKD
jgi:hypothetical protein